MTEHELDIAKLLDRKNWHHERRKLHSILIDCGLHVQVKWGKLCYSREGRNIAIIHATKSYCAIGFFKGALLGDETGALTAPGANSRAMRQLRFEELSEITTSEDSIRKFVKDAIQLEVDGSKVAFAEKDNPVYPPELQNALDADPDLAEAFASLTPGRRRAYVLHISGAKQSETRLARIERCSPRIRAGKGFNER